MKKILVLLSGLLLCSGIALSVYHFVGAESLYGDAVVLDTAPLRISSEPSSDVIANDDTLDVLYTIENPSDGPGEVSVTLSNLVPVWGTMKGEPVADAASAVYDASAGTETFTLGAGETTYISFSYEVDPTTEVGELSYGLRAVYSYPDSTETLDYTTVLEYSSSVALVGNALDLKLDVAASPSSISHGDIVTFTYVVTNNETVALSGEAAILAQLPADFTYMFENAGTTSALTTTSYDVSEGVLSIHNLLPGGVVTLVLVAEYTGDGTGSDIVQDVYLTHAYFFSGNRDADGNLVEVPEAVDFTVVDQASLTFTKESDTLPFTFTGAVSPSTFSAGDNLTLTYTFAPSEPNGETSWNFANGTFSMVLPEGITPTDITATYAVDTWDGDVESVSAAVSFEETAWSFDSATRTLSWSSTDSWAMSFIQGLFNRFVFTVTASTSSSLSETAFSFPGTVGLTGSGSIADQEFSTILTATRNDVVAEVPSSGGSSGGSSSSSGSSGGSSGGSSSGSSGSSSGSELTYAIYIVNPDGTMRSSEGAYSGYSLTHSDRYGIVTFDDSGEDMDLNDVVVHVDSRSCDAVDISVQEVHASWDHQVGIAVFKGETQLANYILFSNDHTSMGTSKELDLESLLGSGKTCKSAKVRHDEGVKDGGCVHTCDTLATAYYLSILNPDGTHRDTFSPYVQIDRKGNRQFTLNFEDSGTDSDYNDVVLNLDVSNCRDVKVTGVSVDAEWHHAIYGSFYYDDILVSDKPIVADSHTLIGQTVTIDANDELVMCTDE